MLRRANPRRDFRPVLGAVVAAASALVASACVPSSASPDGAPPQNPPISSNGLGWDGTSLWVCDLFGGQLLQLDPSSGAIRKRFGPDTLIQPPDDLVFTSDGSIIYTSPVTGVVGRIRPGGAPEVLAKLDPGVNPIALESSGTSVVVGARGDDADRVVRIDLATGVTTTVVSGITGLNGFSFGPDGALWAPTGGIFGGIANQGGLARIDTVNGTWEQIPLTFPDLPAKTGIAFAVSAKWTTDGRLMLLEGIGGTIYNVDPDTGVARVFARLGSEFADNQVAVPGGGLFATDFVGGVYRVSATGSVSRLVP